VGVRGGLRPRAAPWRALAVAVPGRWCSGGGTSAPMGPPE